VLEKGISLLPDRSWREDYDLTLALHNTSAELSDVLGDFEIVRQRCDAMFQNSRLLDHTFLACSMQISIRSANGNTDEAIQIGIDILEKIGEPIKARPTKVDIAHTLLRLRRLLRKLSPNTIGTLPLMSDSSKAASMQIMNHMIMPAHFGRESLLPELVLKLVQITIQHGLCNVSSVAFGWFGLILAAQGQIQLATNYGELALELLDRFDSKQWLPRVYLCVYGGIFGWHQSMKKAIDPLSQGYHVGIETGDREVSHQE
jgi:predicted ATPase